MKLRHRIAGWLLPELKNLAYTSAGQGRRSQSWMAPSTGPNNSLTGNLGTLIKRSRAAIRNDPWAASGLEKLVANIVGTGIKPKSEARDNGFRKELQALFLDWTDESDADGQLDFYGQQALAMRSVLEAGECFVRFRPRKPGDGLSVPLQLQLLEAEFVPWDYNDDLKKGHKIRAGIEFNAIGQRVAYWLHKQHPSDYTTLDTADLRRVPADQVLHLYEPLRPGQLRGQPLLSQVLLRMYHLDKFDDATLLRQEIANLFTGFITKPAPETEKVDPLTGRPIVYDLQGVPMVAMEPGTMQELSPGEEITFNTPPGAASNYPDFIRQQLMAVSAGIGLPYEILSGDMKGVSDRALRVVLNEFRRRIQQIQHNLMAFQLCRPVWKRWLELAVLSGAISAPDFHRNPAHYRKVKWIPQGWAYIHPVQDVQSQNLAVRSGFKSRSEVVSEQGYDSEQIDDEIAADNQRADELELQYDSDARTQEINNTIMEEEPDNDEQKPLNKNRAWFTLKNQSGQPAELLIYDVIGDWAGLSARQLVSSLKDLDTDDITVRINSPGGSVFDGVAIYNALRYHKANIHVRIEGLAASIASVIAMAGDTIHMAENALLMIHNPFGWVGGDAGELRKMADMLDKTTEVIAQTYCNRCELDLKAMLKLMDEETWFTATEAQGHGLIDEVEAPVKMAAHFDLSSFMHPPQPANSESENGDKGAHALAVMTLCNQAGYPEMAEAFVRQQQGIEDVKARLAECETIKSLCAAAHCEDRAGQFIQSGKTEAQVRTELFDLLLQDDDSINNQLTPDQQDKKIQPLVDTQAVYRKRNGQSVA